MGTADDFIASTDRLTRDVTEAGLEPIKRGILALGGVSAGDMASEGLALAARDGHKMPTEPVTIPADVLRNGPKVFPTPPTVVNLADLQPPRATDDELYAARDVLIELLGKLEDEADHAADNAQQWGPGDNRQVRLWQATADENRAYAAALRTVLGLPPRVERNADD